MDAEHRVDLNVSSIAAAIGEPARAKILFSLVDGQARTSTELSVVADMSPSTTSEHLDQLKAAKLVVVLPRGKQRLYSLAGPDVARALEALTVFAGGSRDLPIAPNRLRAARTCYVGKLHMKLRKPFPICRKPMAM